MKGMMLLVQDYYSEMMDETASRRVARPVTPKHETRYTKPCAELCWSIKTAGREKLLHKSVQRFQGGLVLKAHRPLFCSTLGLRVIEKEKTGLGTDGMTRPHPVR